MISLTITQKIGEALKAHNEIRVSTLRLLSSAFNYEKIAKQHELSEEEEIVVVRREAKKRKEAIEALRQAQGKLTIGGDLVNEERLKKEEKELKILQGFLPPEMPDDELEKIIIDSINQIGAKSIADMGKVIGLVKDKTKGRAEGGKIAEMVKEKLVI